MASPQAENGHTDIANEIMEALCKVNLCSHEWRIIVALLRKTYGWHKKEDGISLRQFEELTHIASHNVVRTVKQLEKRNIIIVKRTIGGKGRLNYYQFQKDYYQWLDTNYQTISYQMLNSINPDSINPDSINPDNQTVSIQIVTKETITKETNNNNNKGGEKLITEQNKEAIYESMVDALKEKYPELDINNEWDKCKAWWEPLDEKSNGKKQSNWKLRILNWYDHASKYSKAPPRKNKRKGYTVLPSEEEIIQEWENK